MAWIKEKETELKELSNGLFYIRIEEQGFYLTRNEARKLGKRFLDLFGLSGLHNK